MNKSLKALLRLLKTVLRYIKQFYRPQNSLHRIVYISFISFLITLSSPFIPYSLLPTPYSPSLQVLAQSTDARKAEADKLFQQGIEQAQTSQFEAAFKFWQQALDIYREIKDREGEGIVLSNLGITYLKMEEYPKAIEYQEQSLKIFQEIKYRRGEAYALRSLSSVYSSMEDYPKAIEYQQQSLKIFQEIKDRQGEGAALGNLGLAYYSMGDYPKAIEYLQQTLKIAQEIKDRKGEGQSLSNLGNAYNSMGDYPKAIEYLQQTLKIAQEIKDRQGEGTALGNLGIAYYRMADYPKAIEYYLQRLKIAQEIKDRQGEGQSLGNLGAAYHSMGDYPKAIEYLQQTLKILQQIKDRQGEGAALGNLGLAYYSTGDYPKAIEYHLQRLKTAQEIKDRQGEGQSLGNLAIAYNSMGDYPKAIEYLQQTLKIAREIKDRNSEGATLGNLGLAYYRMGDYPKAIEYYLQGLKIAQKIKDRDGEGIALNNLGRAYYKIGNLQLAESTLEAGIKVSESLRGGLKDNNKITIFEQQSKTYRTLQQVLIAQNKTDAALLIAERGRARAFVELLASKFSSNPNEKLSTPPNIEQIKQIAKSQNATFAQYSIIGDEFKIKGKSEWKESELYIWVIKPTGEVTFRKSDLKPLWQKDNTTLSQLVSTTRKSLGVRDDERGMFEMKIVNPGNEKLQQTNLQKLHLLLIKPIADILPTDPNQRVIFVPQDDLFLVPFSALLDEQGKYLIEKHTITTAPAIQVLELTRQQKQRLGVGRSIPQNAVVVGNPTMPEYSVKYGEPPKQLKPLLGSEREAKAIAPLLNTQALIGSQATETAIKAKLSQAGVIHFATHGLFDNFQGLQSSIALAPSTKDNGFLTAEEILDLKLNADLVVLSACNTGRGKITGDGVIGLSRSLFIAGTPSVLVSLWAVPDAPTAELMTEFYQNLYQKKLDKAQSLRQAMLKMNQRYPNSPRNWAAFTLTGEAQ